MKYEIIPKKSINGIFSVPPDKSLTHRAVILHSLIDAKTTIYNANLCDDCLATVDCMRNLGVDINIVGDDIEIVGKGISPNSFSEPKTALNAKNSATTLRMVSGLLSVLPFSTKIYGDNSLNNRPMKRIVEPLSLMGAKIEHNNFKPPLKITGTDSVLGINYKSEVASAQVKSSVLMASLFSNEQTIYKEPTLSRNHTETLLKFHGADIKNTYNTVTIKGNRPLIPYDYSIAGDFSSAAFLIAMALILKDSEIIITNVNVNATRTGFIRVLMQMGADIEILNRRNMCFEPVADIKVRSSKLKGTLIEGNIIPSLIDEIPILTVLAAISDGKTTIKDAQELRLKESDRINAMAVELSKMGAKITQTADGLEIEGVKSLMAANLDSHNDHRILMSLSIAALTTDDKSQIEGYNCITTSFADFYDVIGGAARD